MRWLRKSGRAVVIAAGNENRPDKDIYLRRHSTARTEHQDRVGEWVVLADQSRGACPCGSHPQMRWRSGTRCNPAFAFASLHLGKTKSASGCTLGQRSSSNSRAGNTPSSSRIDAPHGKARPGSTSSCIPVHARREYVQVPGWSNSKPRRSGRANPRTEFATTLGSNAPSRTEGFATCDRGSRTTDPLKAITMTTPATARQRDRGCELQKFRHCRHI